MSDGASSEATVTVSGTTAYPEIPLTAGKVTLRLRRE
jgi:hypothetical protein